MRSILIWGILISASYGFCQNLVPNPSFEDTIGCPNGVNQVYKAKFWSNPTQASPDYYNSCDPMIWGQNVPYTGFGYQPARTGSAFIGFYAFIKGMPNAREYVQVKLTDTLLAGRKYLVSFFVNLTNNSQYSLSSLGSHFSFAPITSTTTLVMNYTPQIQNDSNVQLSDSTGWMLIQDTLLSNGSEVYLTIGNFYTDIQSDTTYHGWWSSNNIAYYYLDDVSVIDVESLGINESFRPENLRVYPNPSTGTFSISNLNGLGNEVSIEVRDVTGKIVVRKNVSSVDGVLRLNLDLNNGVYFINAVGEDRAERKGKVVISK